MSKKLIAVAAAAALALTGLVALPASGAAITSVTVSHGSAVPTATEAAQATTVLTVSQTNSDSAFAAKTAAVARDVLFGNSTDTATRTAVRATVKTASAAAITITSTLGVKISASTTDGAGTALKVDAGSQSLTGTTSSANLDFVFFAWNTSTTAGAVTVDTGTSKLTFFVKGTLYEPYNLTNVTFPASLFKGQTDGKVTFQVTDPYGNQITTGTGITPTGFGATFSAATYSSTTKLWSAAIPTVTGDNVAIQLALANVADLSANGFAKPVVSAFSLVAAGDLEAQVTALTTQVATLQSQLDASRLKVNSVTKKRWNNLVLRHRALGGSAKLK